MKRAVFLDRDGVINRASVRDGKLCPPSTFSEFVLLPKVREAIASLHEAGFVLIVVTNQPDVGRQTQKKEIVEKMHDFLLKELPLDAIEVCFDEKSACYKPSPKMLFNSAKRFNIDLPSSFMIGDRWRDIGAGRAAGCFTILIKNHYIEMFVKEEVTEKPDQICDSLFQASQFILKKDT